MMRRILSVVLSAVLLLMPAAFGEQMTMNDYEPLSKLAEKSGFKMGAPLSYSQMKDALYLNLLARHFASVTPTNEMKAYSLLDQQASRKSEDGMPRMNYAQADKMVAWAREKGLGVRGHTLCWDAYMTEWFFHENYDSSAPIADRETMRLRLKSYIEQVVTHFETEFPGTVYCWDVVNEAVGDSITDYDASDARHIRVNRSGNINVFREYVGEDYVEYAFLCARDTVEALGCDTKLYYNDYNAFYTEKRNAILALTESINSYAPDGNGGYRRLVDGVGMQGYIGGYGQQQGCMNDGDLPLIKNSILAYADAGLEVQITEMAVRNYDRDQAQKHAEFYARLFKVFRSVDSGEEKPLVAVSIWGLTDNPLVPKNDYNYSMNSTYGGLITERLLPKAATELVYEVLREAEG